MNRDFLSRLTVGVLFVFLSINLLNDFRHTHHFTSLLLLVSESLVVVLMVFRRPTAVVDRSLAASVVAAVSIVGPPLFRVGGSAVLPDAVTATLSVIGLLVVIAGKLSLGRSFGIVAANRGVVASGPYLFVRHPIYVGYLISYVAFSLANPTPLNLAVVIMTDASLVARALIEERTLVNDESYRTYCNRVAWHFLPGVF